MSALLYSGCYVGNGQKYLLKDPVAIAYNNVPADRNARQVTAGNLVIEVAVPMEEQAYACNFSLPGNMAYAYTSRLLIDTVVDIRVRPTNDYGSYKALDDISAICTFVHVEDPTIADKTNLIWRINRGYYDGTETFSIRLNESPLVAREQSFIIELITDKYARLADTTEPLIITP